MICLLERLKQVPDPEPLPALRLNTKEQLFELDLRHFSCCDGHGGFYDEPFFKSCRLFQNLARVQKLYAMFQKRWQRPLQFEKSLMTPSEAKFLANLMNQRLSGKMIKGRALSTATPIDQPSLKFWHWAFFCAWRFGMPSYVLTLGGNSDDLARVYLEIDDDQPILFLEQKVSLQDQAAAYEFDALVDWCEKRNASLWLDLVKPAVQPKKTAPAVTMKERFAEQIAALKNQPPLNWLGPDTRSRLSGICSDVNLFLG